MSIHFVIRHIDDEAFDIECNKQDVGSFNHDQHGWSGMEAAERLVQRIASVTGATVEHTYGEEADEE